MKATIRDCIYGQAVGDALGVPYEFRTRGTFECPGMVGHGSHDQPAGTWSDDTSMALATCDSIRVIGRIDVRDMRGRFVRWYCEDVYTVNGLFDIGGTTADALSARRGRTGARDNGNGSLMRILPLAFTNATDDEVRAVSSITHAHAVSCESCVRMVHAARRLIAGEGAHGVACDLVGTSEGEFRSGGYGAGHRARRPVVLCQHIGLCRVRACGRRLGGRYRHHRSGGERVYLYRVRHRRHSGEGCGCPAWQGRDRVLPLLRLATRLWLR